MVQAGGQMVYATCSILLRKMQDQVANNFFGFKGWKRKFELIEDKKFLLHEKWLMISTCQVFQRKVMD